MRYLTLLRASHPATPPPAELMEAIMKLGEDATAAGTLLDQGGLAPSAAGARLRVYGGELSVTDGPFAEAKETVSYALFEVRSKQEAVEWSARFLKLHHDLWEGWEGEIDVLKVMGPEDFADPA